MDKAPRVKGDWVRTAVQAAVTLLYNCKLPNFFRGVIDDGPLKHVCVPGLNCYSCPGAIGACPMGALQNMPKSKGKVQFPYYVLGMLILFGLLLGRFICGFLCPFGWVQDLLYRIPFFKKVRTFKGDRVLRFVKYGVLVLLCFLFPMLLSGKYNTTPFFCKFLCPSGTLLAAIPMLLNGAVTTDQLGVLFWWKFAVLNVVLVTSLAIARPFCRYLCPLGAFYGLFNRVSVVKVHFAPDACVRCGKCAAVCPMGLDPTKEHASVECIRCGRCAKACPTHALKLGVLRQKGK